VNQQILEKHREKSRYYIIREILYSLYDREPVDLEQKVKQLAIQYNDIVLLGAKTCMELGNAQQILIELSAKYSLFLSSNTPKVYLRGILDYLKWDFYFKEIFGYPRDKSDTLKIITQQRNLNPARVLVVGDGESDRISEKNDCCCFYPINHENSLGSLLSFIAQT
jgi:phosphoglycolate phosphatase-like HAD superfamily hydrolase